MDPKGILAVLMQPDVSLEEDKFHEWYNNEHGPKRLQLPFICTGTRYRASDGQTPTWLALYDLEDVSVLSHPSYRALRDNRSQNEVNILRSIPVLERRAARLISTKGSFTQDTSVLRWVEMRLKSIDDEDELHRWYEEEHIDLVSKIPGWRRSRRYRIVDADSHEPVNSFIAVHDYASENGLPDSRELQRAISTPWSAKIFSLLSSFTGRTLELHYKLGPAPRDLLHVPDKEKVIDTSVPHDGFSLHYRLEGCVNDSSPVIIFCNGLNCDLHLWDAAIAYLKPRFPDYRFLRYDTRGYRFEGCDKPLNLEIVVQDIKALLDSLAIPKAHALIGVSMGGLTTVAFASRYPDRLSKFVACDFSSHPNKADGDTWVQRVRFAKKEGMEALGKQSVERWFTSKSRDTPQWNKAISMVASASPEGMESSVKVLLDYDETENIRRIRLPGLYVVGAEDGCARHMEELVATIATNAEFCEIQDAGHLPMLENVSGFVDCVERFLR